MLRLSGVIVGAAVGVILLASSCTQIEEGERGVKVVWGKVTGDPLTPGLQFQNPFSTKIITMNVKETRWDFNESCFTKDNQSLDVKMAVTAYVDPLKAGDLYTQFGMSWAHTIIDPAAKRSVKDAVGEFIADDMIAKRELMQSAAFNILHDSLLSRGIILTRLDFTNIDFNDDYEKAVERKVVAMQRAQQAVNETIQVQEQAKQTVIQAKSDAEAMRIKSEALSRNQNLVQYEMVQKWDGHLPGVVLGNGSMPILNMDKLNSKGM